MRYKGYVARVELDEEAGVFHGRVVNTSDVITFEGDSVEGLRREFAASVDDYLDFCQERGEEPEKPFSGRFVLRLDPDLHRDVAIETARVGESINAWITYAIRDRLQQPARRAFSSAYRLRLDLGELGETSWKQTLMRAAAVREKHEKPGEPPLKWSDTQLLPWVFMSSQVLMSGQVPRSGKVVGRLGRYVGSLAEDPSNVAT